MTMSVSQPTVSFDASVAFDPQTAPYDSPSSVLVTGTAAGAGLANVEIYDGTDDLGAATINADTHGWALDLDISPGLHRLTAVATDLFGHVASVRSPWELITGISGRPYADQELDLDGSGRVVATKSYDAAGELLPVDAANYVEGGVAGQVLESSHNDVFTGGGANTHYVFSPFFGRDEITNFAASGAAHDVISLPHAEFQSLAQVFRHIATALDGSALLHVNNTDLTKHSTIKFDGVTKADLIAHPDVFRFHG